MSKFSPSAAEVALVNQIFTQVDTQKVGVINGEAAVKIFSGAKLPANVLAEIWSLSDDENNGILTRKGVAVAIRLLGHAQRGERITEASIHKPGGVPTIEGLNAPIAGQTTGMSLPRSPPPGLPPLTAQDKAKFMKLFVGCGPSNGLLSGDKARDVLVKSKLPVDKLSQIWNLADTKNRGALDATDFSIAMYFIQASMSGQVQTLPQTLPQSLYEQAAARGGAMDTVTAHATGESASLSPTMAGFSVRPLTTIQPQYTGQSHILQPQSTGQAFRPANNAPTLPARNNTTGVPPAFPFQPQANVQWDVTAAEKANADRLFDGLDSQKKGYIEGDVAVPFMVQSGLSDDILAQIWDLADLSNDGHLTRDGFAVAMHLIQQKLAGKDVPTSLPPTLVPPSMRATPPQAQVPEAIRDLLWDDTPPPSATTPQPPPPILQAQATGTISPQHTATASVIPRSQPFGGTDPFASQAFQAPVSNKNLLEDDDEPAATSPPLQDRSAEIGNVQNQLDSTSRSLATTKNDRVNVERALSEQASQLTALQTQLASAKSAYETETRLLDTLRERSSVQTADIQKARGELISAESDLSAIRVEKAEIEGSVLRDKEEIRGLQRSMTEVGGLVEGMRAEVEKLKKEAKQQKGLLAIAKKQLATREAERAKVAKELEEARAEAEAANKEREEADADLARDLPTSLTNGHEGAVSPAADVVAIAAAHPLPSSPEEFSPAATPNKSTNPFERLAMASPSSRAQSPFLPFGNSALATPPIAATAVVDAAQAVPQGSAPDPSDPFGFSQAFGTDTQSTEPEPQPTVLDTTSARSSVVPSFPPGLAEIPHLEHEVMSPSGSDLFMTPPTTATIAQSPSPAGAEHGVVSLTAAVAHFPEIDPQVSGHFPEAGSSQHEEHTDLGTQLQERDVEESDSDSDSESDIDSEDNEPLNAVKDRLGTETSPARTHDTTEPSTASSGSAFDDSFGLASNAATVESIQKASSSSQSAADTSLHSQPPVANVDDVAKDVFGNSPFDQQSQTVHAGSTVPAVPEAPKESGTASAAPEALAGVNDFDEALGKLPASSGSAAFSFDSAFEDDFDFAAAKAATDPSITSSALNGSAVTAGIFPPAPTSASKNDGFDAVFVPRTTESPATLSSVPAAPAQGSASHAPGPVPTTLAPALVPIPAPASAQASQSFSFDDAFGTANAQPAPSVDQSTSNNGVPGISFDDAFGGHASEFLSLENPLASSSYQPPSGPPPSAPFPTASPPTSPGRDSNYQQLEARRSISPPRATSPPPRHSSPKQRPSTASSEKEKAPPTRHSKLSIRLPFGRKKAKQEAPPLPSRIASQRLVEDPTPAAEDDIEAVKTLCSMGFSRTQAVTALERHSYDVQRALNSLLGQ